MTRRSRASTSRVLLVVLVVILVVGCAGRAVQGVSSDIKWRVGELRTSERTATAPGYKGDGKVRDYRYVVVLEESRGIGVEFQEVETLITVGPGFRATPRTAPLRGKLAPNGQLRITMTDNTWTVIPQWFEGAARPVNLDPIARKVFMGTNDRGEKVKLVIEFALESIPTQ